MSLSDHRAMSESETDVNESAASSLPRAAMRFDRLGRARRPGQERGLIPRHPVLPEDWESRSLRVAMPRSQWLRLEQFVARLRRDARELELSQPRALGRALTELLDRADAPEADPLSGPNSREPSEPALSLGTASGVSSDSLADWLDWEHRKFLRLRRARFSV